MNRSGKVAKADLTPPPSSAPLIHLLSQLRSPAPLPQQPGSFLSLYPQRGNTEAPSYRSHTLLLSIKPVKQALREEGGCCEWEADTPIPCHQDPDLTGNVCPFDLLLPQPAALATMEFLKGGHPICPVQRGAMCD